MKRLFTTLSFFLTIISCTKEPIITPDIEKFNVVITAKEGGKVNTTGGSIPKGSTFSVLATPEKDYDFFNWNPGGLTENPLKIIINSDIDLQAVFKPKDDDKDGVYNINDLCTNTSVDSLVSFKGCYPENFLEALNYNVLVSAGFSALYNYNENDLLKSMTMRFYNNKNQCYIDAPLNVNNLYTKNLKQTKIISKSFSEIKVEVTFDSFIKGELVRNIKDTITSFWDPKQNGLMAQTEVFKGGPPYPLARGWQGVTGGPNYLKTISQKRRDGAIPRNEVEYQNKMFSATSQPCSKTKLNDNEYFFSEYFQNAYFKYQDPTGKIYLLHMFPFAENQYELYILENACTIKFTNKDLKNLTDDQIVVRWNPESKSPDQYNSFKYFAQLSHDNRFISWNGNDYDILKINDTPTIISTTIPNSANKYMTKITADEFQKAIIGLTLCK
jgi:hypothetical protein